MEETQKPFACTETGCEMTFTNEDHLNWHRKKHDMMLNLGTTKSIEVADQTPTPTRFIRNCEEVGLFQDLQNVNPFDEFFKKAVELVKTGGSLEVPETNSDDTLHTPNILPHIEIRDKVSCPKAPRDEKTQSNDFDLNNVTSHRENGKKDVIVINSGNNEIKKKIKEVLQNKEKKDKLKFLVNDRNHLKLSNTDEKQTKIENKKMSGHQDESRDKIREMNRAAQMRCRKRKQMRLVQMEEELEFLREQNRKLYKENCNLKLKIEQLQHNTKGHSKLEECSQVDQEIGTTVSSSNPILIQLIPTLSGITVPMIPTLTSGQLSIPDTMRGGQKKVKKKKLRKLIPVIKIEN